jgi:SAM-dependent methyltransferase
MAAKIEISYSADIRGYELGAPQSPRDLAQRDHAAATRTVGSLMEAAYELASELRGMGPTAHELHRDRHGLPLHQRLAEVLQAVRDLQTDLASLRGTVLVPQLEALGVDEHSSNLKVHIGCGGHELPGWINVDNHPAPLAINLNWGLPLPDRSARYVFLSHLLEHLFYPVQSGQLLAEIRRVLAPGGIVRIVVPDIEQCMKAYVEQNDEFFAARRRHWTWLPPDATNLESFLAYAGAGPTPGYLFEHHKFGYDFDTLRQCLERVGFVNVRRCEYQRSPHAPLRVDHASSNALAKHGEQHYSLFVEAQV